MKHLFMSGPLSTYSRIIEDHLDTHNLKISNET